MLQTFFEHPQFDPVMLSLGTFEIMGYSFTPAIRWYGFMYLMGLLGSMFLLNRMAAQSKGLWTKEQVSDLLFHLFLGVILGGRAGYVFFYHLDFFLADPLYLFKIYEGGMSFHGGLIGVLIGLAYHAKVYQRHVFDVADVVAPTIPLGLGFGRLGNFINGELWGRVTDVPWAMIFPQVDGLPRHPSQLYQFALEGVLLFILLQWYQKQKQNKAL